MSTERKPLTEEYENRAWEENPTADAILQAFSVESAPVDIKKILLGLGMNLLFVERIISPESQYQTTDTAMSPFVLSCGFKGQSRYIGKPFIELHEGQPIESQRMFAAHGLCHLLLHNEEDLRNANAGWQCPSLKTSRYEDEANQYALDLLVPEHMFTKFIREGCLNLKDLARRFHVPEEAIRRRFHQFQFSHNWDLKLDERPRP